MIGTWSMTEYGLSLLGRLVEFPDTGDIGRIRDTSLCLGDDSNRHWWYLIEITGAPEKHLHRLVTTVSPDFKLLPPDVRAPEGVYADD